MHDPGHLPSVQRDLEILMKLREVRLQLSFPPTEIIELKNTSSTAPTHDDEAADAVLESATSTSFLMTKHKAPEGSWHSTTRTLRISALTLHSVLIAVHFLLIGIWASGVERRITIALDDQKLVSYLITSTTTACGTIYSAVLVFVTQKLAIRRSLQTVQMLTATHDNTAAWAGIGAAVSLLWNRTKVASGVSTMGVLSAFTYLAAILGLHTTSSSLFSLVASNTTRTYVAGTQGLPALNTANLDTVNDMAVYSIGSLSFLLSTINSEATLGLDGGTLYDVLDTSTAAPGNAIMDATGFNVTCGSLATPNPLLFGDQGYTWDISEDLSAIISPTQSGMISTASSNNYGAIFYSTIPILDSDGEQGALVALSPPMNTSISSIQVFRCSLSLITQVVVVDSQTQQIRTVEPNFSKTTSKWVPYTDLENSEFDLGGFSYPNVTDGNVLIDLWETWYQTIPSSGYYLDYSTSSAVTASIADIYLIQKLNLPAANHSDTQNITLHDLENALSTLVASMFWTLGHMPPLYRVMTGLDDPFANGTVNASLNTIPTPPILLAGNATCYEIFPEVRLELSIIAVSAGLVVSLVLMAVSLPLLRQSKSDEDLPIDGIGILHTIWLYRNHPGLEKMLEQVEYPTDENLRAAGMVRTRLVGGGHGRGDV
ncbi:hypothetical protein B0H12DRAFT_1240129 [Mycena haematopus]|nr:hypothetical protein B0H12DRAFT_1240129 [Mycena haematopus]